MRITFLITMGIERPSGRRYFAIARELVERGHRVRLLALHPDLSTCAQHRFVQAGVEVWYVGQMHARKRGSATERFGPLALLWVLLSSTLGMIWGIMCSPAAVYHLGKPQPVNGLAALIGVSMLRRKRFFVDCDDDEVLSNRLTAPWQRAVFGFWQWLLPGIAAGVTVNTSFLAGCMRRRGIAPVVLVPNGVEIAQFTRPDPAVLAALRTALGLEGRQVIGYAGTLALQNHPVDLLLAAFALLAGDFPTLALLLIGAGEDSDALQARAAQLGLQDRVYFSGHVAHSTVRALLALADLSVDPVHNDDVARARSPLKLVESLALGVPCVTGAVGDRVAVLADGGGWLCAGGSAQALADTLRVALGDQAWLRAESANAPMVAARYDWAALAANWEYVYTTQLGKANRVATEAMQNHQSTAADI